MSAIHGIVTKHGALLQMTSSPEVGTTFKVYFPVTAITQNGETELFPAVAPKKGSGTILLVDDEQVLRDMATTLLGAMGFATLTAEDGEMALEIYREHGRDIDAILLDLTMPKMGGIATYHELRKSNATLPIIICSGYSAESVDDVIAHDPHACFVQKPYNPVALRSALTGMMG
jgi:CheY-like chemotaxis protein